MTTHLDRVLPTLTFRLTRDDWAAFEQLPTDLLGWEKLLVFGPPVFCGLALGWFDTEIRALLPFDLDSGFGIVVLGVVVLALSYVTFMVLMNVRTRWRTARRQLLLTDTIVDGDLDGVTVSEGSVTRRHGWADLTVIETATHLFLCPTPREPIILPLRAFDGREEMYLYAHTARELGNQESDLP